jgi:CBS domain-containing protein
MISKNVRQLPVVDADGKLVGMISWKEIIAKLSA